MKLNRDPKSESKGVNIVIKTSMDNSYDSRWCEVKIDGKNILSRSGHIAVFFDTKMYVHGGYDADRGVLSDFYRIDLAPNCQQFVWKKLNNTLNGEPIRLKSHSAIAYKTMIIIFGGEQVSGDGSNTVYAYDVVDGNWKSIKTVNGDIIPKVDSHCVSVIGDTMYVYGGYMSKIAAYMKNIYALNLDKMEWKVIYEGKEGNQEPQGRSSSSMVAFQDCLWIFGGTNGSKTLNDLWKFDLKSSKWEKIQCSTPPQPRRGHSMVLFKDLIFMFGGIQDVTKQKNDMYIYEFKSNTWSKIQTFTNSVYDCSPTLKRQKKDSSKSPDKFSIHRLSPEKTSQSGDVMKKILAENKQKKFMQKKKQLLKQFSEKPQQINKKRSYSPTTQSMFKTLQSIGNQDPNKNDQKNEIIYDESNRFIIGKKPCARDGQTVAVLNNKMYIFGGDRHLMSFNDLYQFDLEKGLKSLELYRSK